MSGEPEKPAYDPLLRRYVLPYKGLTVLVGSLRSIGG